MNVLAISPAQVRALTRNFLLGFPVYLIAALLAFLNAYITIAICSGLWIFWAFTSFERIPVTVTSLESKM
jgi:uncharacterized membrane protein